MFYSPMAARSILAADGLGCVEETISIIAMLSEAGSLFFRPKDKKLHADSARARTSTPVRHKKYDANVRARRFYY